MQRLTFNIGRRQFRGSYAGSSQENLRQQFNESMSQVLDNLREVIAGIDGATPELVVEALRPTYEKTQNLVPVKTSALKESGYLEARKMARGAQAEMGYGLHGKPDYAIYVHEMPYHHDDPTTDKFLERPVLEDWNEYPARLAASIREAVGAGA